MSVSSSARSRGRRPFLWLGSLFVALACMSAGRAPVPTNPGLSPRTDEGSAASVEGAFRVVAAAPMGEAAQTAQLSLVFDRPVRALGSAEGPQPPFALTPAVRGAWRWVGSRAAVFVPESPLLPAATAFVVEVPGEFQALDGARLGAPFKLVFSTPRPELVSSSPAEGSAGVLPSAVLELELNQAIDPQRFEQLARLKARGKALAFSVSRTKPDNHKALRLTPRNKLPLDAEIVLELPAGLLGEEGPLPSVQAREVRFRTYGPLRVTSVDCNRETPQQPCIPGSSIGLSLSNPVRHGELRRALQITPALPLRWPSWQDADSTTSYLDVPATLRAGQSYRVSLAGSVRDIYGQQLRGGFSAEVQLGDWSPRVAIGITNGTLIPADSGPIPLAAVNLERGSVVASALSRSDVQALAVEKVELAALVFQKPGAQRLAFPTAARNAIARQTLDPRAVLGPSGLGVLGIASAFKAEARDAELTHVERLAKLSDLAITAKLSRQGSLVWVTRLSTALPVPGAELELWQSDGRRHRYVADGEGFAWLPAQDFAPNLAWQSPDRKAVLFASLGSEWTYENVRDIVDGWSVPVATDFSGELHHEGLLFTDRGVYRPGDSLRLKGIVRLQTARGSRVPSGERVVITLKSPDDEPLRQLERVVSKWGTFDAELQLPSGGRLGAYRLSAKLGTDSIDHAVTVQEYRPQEFEVSVSARPELIQGEALAFEVSGQYLFGAPLANAAVRYTLSRSPTQFTPPGHDQFQTDASAYYADRDEAGLAGGSIGEGEGNLDAQGRFSHAQALKLPGQRGPERVVVEGEVSDPARQSSSGSSSVLVHPAELYLGIQRAEPLFLQSGARVQPNVLALRADGTRVRGQRVRLELLQRRWTQAREDRGGNYPESVSKVVDKTLATCELVTQAVPATCALGVASSGYLVLRATTRDARGNAVEAASGLYALGGDQTSWQSRDDGNLELVLDKPSYEVGDVARVLVKSPFPEASALITVERAGVLHRERRKLQGSLPTFELRVGADFQPNAFVVVELVRPLTRGAASTPSGASRLGYAELRVDTAPKRLDVQVAPSARELRPRDEVTVDVSVRDAAGKPRDAEIALYAVDEGVLLLTGYQTPDPLAAFTQSRPLQVATLDSRRNLATIVSRGLEGWLTGNKGAEGGGGGEAAARSQFQQTAFFNPSLVTVQGRARARFRLPDSLTRYRVMAVVVGDAEFYGFGSSSLTVSKRLMARPALPRLLRVGDVAEAGVVVSAKEFAPGEVTVRAKLSGLTLSGPAIQRVKLEPNSSQEVRFTLRAERVGSATLRFDVEGGGERDAVEVTRPVLSPSALQAVAAYGSTTSHAAEGLGNLAGVRPEVGGLEVSVASTALVGLESSLGALVDYPYGCTEQLASRLLPLVGLQNLAKDFGLASQAPSSRAVERGVGELVARQRGDGGFGMWPDSAESHPWASAYALWILHEAHARGATLPARSLASGKDYLRRLLDGDWKDPLLAASAALALDVLAELGDPDAGHMNRLFESRAELPVFARALLLHALALGKQAKDQVAVLNRELVNQVRLNGSEAVVIENLGDAYAVLMDSPARTQAMVLRAFLVSGAPRELLSPLARGILSARRAGSFRSTQEGAFALLALDAYRAAVERERPDFDARVQFGTHQLLDQHFEGRTLTSKSAQLGMAQLIAQKERVLRFERAGSGTLFYQTRLRYAPLEAPHEPLDAGFFVKKTLRPVQPAELGAALASSVGAHHTQFPGAGLVLCDLLIVTPSSREYVVIDDPLPAGFEAVNSELATTTQQANVSASLGDEACAHCDASQRDDLAHGRALRSSDFRRELRDDRVLFFVDHMGPGVYHYRYLARATTLGRFVLPPTRAESMYAPEVFGRSFAQQIQVR